MSKIESRRAWARTRQVWVGNPRSNQPLSTYNYGVEAALELMGSPQDLRRFDAVMGVSANDITVERFNELVRFRPRTPQVYTAELCKSLILWSWSRPVGGARFDPVSEKAVLDVAFRLSERYSDEIPIVDRGSIRLKVAKLSAGLAARTFSYGNTPEDILVRLGHVEYVGELLRRIYDAPAMRYDEYTNSRRSAMRIEPADEALIIDAIKQAPNAGTLLAKLSNADWIDERDIAHWGGWDAYGAGAMFALLVRVNAIKRVGDRAYRKTEPFIKLTRGLLEADTIRDNAPPSFVPPKGEF